MAGKPPEFAIAGSLVIGQYPHIPIRFLLQAQLRDALGITEDDIEEIAARAKAKKAGEDVELHFEMSGAPDPFAVLFVKAAAVGLCWPTELECPTLRECRHDIVDYGAGVYDALIRMRAKDGKAARVPGDVRREGNKLIIEMCGEAVGILVEGVEEEKGFSKGREDTSIAG